MNPENEYLIVNSKGEQMKYNNYYREKFEPLMEQLGMKHKPHDTRHTFATLLSNAEANKTSIKKLITEFNITVKKITDLIEIYTEKELFEQNQRQWASSTPSNWPIWKWIHINTVAPFKTFRIKIRKWKRIKN